MATPWPTPSVWTRLIPGWSVSRYGLLLPHALALAYSTFRRGQIERASRALNAYFAAAADPTPDLCRRQKWSRQMDGVFDDETVPLLLQETDRDRHPA